MSHFYGIMGGKLFEEDGRTGLEAQLNDHSKGIVVNIWEDETGEHQYRITRFRVVTNERSVVAEGRLEDL